MNTPTGDTNFEKFRRERRQRRAQFGSQPANVAKPIGMSDVEAYEARQMHETKLTRDVHDFLAEATKHAATIVEKVTQVAEAETAQRLVREMHEFLEATMRRAASFMELVHSQRAGAVVKDLEPHVSNLVGRSLDEFRHEGTAQLADKHIGQDPFLEPLDGDYGDYDEGVGTVEFDDDPAGASAEEPADEGSEQPPVDATTPAADASTAPPPPQPSKQREPQPVPAGPAAREPSPRALASAPAAAADPLAPATAPVTAPTAQLGGVLSERMFRDPQTLKNALKALVRSGVLTPDDARETYRAALQQAGN